MYNTIITKLGKELGMKLLAFNSTYNVYPFREDKYQITFGVSETIGVFNTLLEAIRFLRLEEERTKEDALNEFYDSFEVTPVEARKIKMGTISAGSIELLNERVK